MNVLVINQCAHNKGDRAVLAFVLQELARNGVQNITVSTSDRSYWKHSDIESPLVDVQFVPWGWNTERSRSHYILPELVRRIGFFPHLWYPLTRYLVSHNLKLGIEQLPCNEGFRKSLNNADLVISTGGHHVTTWLSENAVSPQVFDMALAVQSRKKLILWSQSIGPLEFTSTQDATFVRHILQNAQAVYVRDTASLSELAKFGGAFQVRETPESVFGLTTLDQEYTPPQQRSPYLGISIYIVKKRSDDAQREYIHTMAALVDHAVHHGLIPKFFPMALKGTGADDRPVIQQIIAASKYADRCILVENDMNTLAHIREVAGCRAFVGHKTHSIIFALISATPVLALAYHQKSCDFMTQFGLPKYCLSDKDLSQERITSLLDDILDNLSDISVQEKHKTISFATRVRSDFRSILI